MVSKSNLLRNLGWDDVLIKHFMVDDSEYIETPHNEVETEVFDTNTFTINYNALSSGSSAVLIVNGSEKSR